MRRRYAVTAAGFLVAAAAGLAQPPGGGGPGGFGPPGMQQQRKLVAQFDANGDGWLNQAERQAARESLKKSSPPGGRRGPGGMGGGFGPKGNGAAGRPGPKVSPADAKSYPAAGLYDPAVLRTLFLEFENKDWESELEDFHGTDVEVPATLTVDGQAYKNVGVHFRGMSSYGMVPAGSKRSFNLSLDLADPKQRLYGAKTLNLLNAHEDPSLLSTVLYSGIARKYIPTPKANFVKVVVNGESWGVYPSVQQFDKAFLTENYKTDKGTRWKVRGSPGGGGGLDYLGDRPEDYKRRYEIKSADREESWTALVALCKTLNQTPPDKLEAALRPILDVDGLLWFLALDVALINNDGYWVRASDYSLYLDPRGKFHAVPHDMNEAFQPAGGGPGGPGGMMGGFGMRARPGEVLPAPLQDMLGVTEAQKKQLADLQKETDGRLDALLTPTQREAMKRMREGGPGGPGGFGGPGGPGGFGGPGGPPGAGPGGPGGPGGGRPGGMMGGGGRGVELDPLVALDDPRKPLRSKVLAVPALRVKYLANVKAIAEKSLDWTTLGPVVAGYRTLIEAEVAADTRKLDSTEDFRRVTADAPAASPAAPGQGPGQGPGGGRGPGMGRGPSLSLRAFADQRRAYLLNHPEVKAVP